jgi:hypothetical protein
MLMNLRGRPDPTDSISTPLRMNVGGHLAEPPASPLELRRDQMAELGGAPGGGIALLRAQEGSGVGGGDVDRRVLPHDPLRAREPADVKAVHLHLLARLGGVDIGVAPL